MWFEFCKPPEQPQTSGLFFLKKIPWESDLSYPVAIASPNPYPNVNRRLQPCCKAPLISKTQLNS